MLFDENWRENSLKMQKGFFVSYQSRATFRGALKKEVDMFKKSQNSFKNLFQSIKSNWSVLGSNFESVEVFWTIVLSCLSLWSLLLNFLSKFLFLSKQFWWNFRCTTKFFINLIKFISFHFPTVPIYFIFFHQQFKTKSFVSIEIKSL